MCIVYYTVNPDSYSFSKSYIVRIFKEDENADVRCIKTVNFPIRNPSLPNKALSEAEEFGRLAVKEIMDGVAL